MDESMIILKIFVYGVFDMFVIWCFLFDVLDEMVDFVFFFLLFGFEMFLLKGFKGIKDVYVNWFFEIVEDFYKNNGLVDLVGYDWGVFFVLWVVFF